MSFTCTFLTKCLCFTYPPYPTPTCTTLREIRTSVKQYGRRTTDNDDKVRSFQYQLLARLLMSRECGLTTPLLLYGLRFTHTPHPNPYPGHGTNITGPTCTPLSGIQTSNNRHGRLACQQGCKRLQPSAITAFVPLKAMGVRFTYTDLNIWPLFTHATKPHYYLGHGTNVTGPTCATLREI